MQISNPPEIKKKYVIENEKSYTKITFQPDLERLMNLNQMKNDSLDMNLSLDQLMDNIIQLYHRRAMDIAACMPPKITIYLNSKPLPINSFVDYVKRFAKSFSKELTEDNLDSQIFHERINPQWEIAVIRSPYQTFSHMSFVNSIWTSGGGTHVNVITTQLVKAIEEKLSSYNKRKGNDDTSITLSPSLIRNFMMIFINCKIVNPSFDSQSKHTLTSSPLTYGSTFKLSESFINRFLNESNIIQDIIIEFEAREKMKLMRLASKTASNSNIAVDVPKLEDAHYAGKSGHALDCTLILTEGKLLCHI
jgi:DNA topoisomerase-2